MVYRLYRKLLLGIADVDLTENGKNRINEYRKEIDNYRIEIIYTSPYIRVYQTAQILNRDIKVELKVFVLTILDRKSVV